MPHYRQPAVAGSKIRVGTKLKTQPQLAACVATHGTRYTAAAAMDPDHFMQHILHVSSHSMSSSGIAIPPHSYLLCAQCVDDRALANIGVANEAHADRLLVAAQARQLPQQ